MAYTTRKSLLARVRQGDEVSWNDFYDAYKGLVKSCGQDYGLSNAEKEELLQNVMCEVFRRDMLKNFDSEESYDEYFFTHDQTKGRFRNYLRQVVKYQAYKIMRARKNDIRIDDDDNHIQIASPEDDWDNIWEFEWQRHVLNMALIELRGRVQPDTYAAFEMYALQNRPVQEVAQFLDISVSAIYTAKSRCIAVLKEAVKDLENV